METCTFTIDRDALPTCLVGRLEGRPAGIFLPASTLVALRQLLDDARMKDQVPGWQPSNPAGERLLTFLEEVLRPYTELMNESSNIDIDKAMRELRAMAKELGRDDDGPDRA